MQNLFIIQLATSFIVGGSVIALLSLIAERVSSRIAGIILAFPTTAALGFFFLGWATSPEQVARVIPATLVPLGLSMLFAALYPYVAEYFAKYIQSKLWQILFSFVVSISVWFGLAVPIVILQLSNLLVGIAGYVVLVVIAHLLLQRKKYEKPVHLRYTFGQKISRATFVGFIIFLAVFLGKILNPFWGGMFAMFPAAFCSLMMVLHWYYGPKSLFPTMQKVAIGSLSLFAYAITVMLVFPKLGFIVGTIFAYSVSVAVTLLLIGFQRQRFKNEENP